MKWMSVFVEHGKPPVYRYGTLPKTEITLPVPTNPIIMSFMDIRCLLRGHRPMSVLRMELYYVYDGEGRGWNFNGIIVYKDNNIISKKECKDINTSLIISKIIPSNGPYLETYIYAHSF